jgi:CheY-like chemotaxis protein
VAQTIKILLADDDPDVRETLEAILAEPGYTVLTASDGYEAVRLLAEHWINLLITDVRMPGINGFELARQAKLMRPQIQVIYFSGFRRARKNTPARSVARPREAAADGGTSSPRSTDSSANSKAARMPAASEPPRRKTAARQGAAATPPRGAGPSRSCAAARGR